jgi:histone H3/H4
MVKLGHTAPVKKISAAVIDFKNKLFRKNMAKAANAKPKPAKKQKEVVEEGEILTKKKKRKIKDKRFQDLKKTQKAIGKHSKGLPYASFRRVVDEVLKTQAAGLDYTYGTNNATKNDFRIQASAVKVLLAASEETLMDLFKFANVTAVNNKRQTVKFKDFAPEVTRMFAKHIFQEAQSASSAAKGMKNIEEWAPKNFKKDTDFDLVIGKKKAKIVQTTVQEEEQEEQEEDFVDPEGNMSDLD